MHFFRTLRQAALLPALCVPAWALCAAQQAPAAQVVVVQATVDADEVPYARFLKGMAVFEQNRQLAPAATLRFRLYPRAKDASFDGLVLTLAGGGREMRIELDPRQGFALPDLPELARAGAVVMTNKRSGTYAWRVDIRTPGLPPNTRRLGDLRLECKVDMKGAALRRVVRNPALVAMSAVDDPCTYRTFEYPFFAERPVFNVTLVWGTRRESLAAEWLYTNSARHLPEAVYALADWRYTRDRQYVPPIADRSWPDDTLVVFEYMDDETEAGAQR